MDELDPQIPGSLIQGPLFLNPDNFTENVWGGTWLPRFKGVTSYPGRKIGESWELSTHSLHPSRIDSNRNDPLLLADLISKKPIMMLGEKVSRIARGTVPTLLKIIDAQENLSIQVHPPDGYAKQHEKEGGKSEYWVILEPKDLSSSYIYIGFNPQKVKALKRAQSLNSAFFEAIKTSQENSSFILSFLNKILVKPGEVYRIPAGTIHAIGSGTRVFELQQASNLTYRIWDWGRVGRPLHLEKARDVLDFRARFPSYYRLKPRLLKKNRKGSAREEKLVEDKKRLLAATRISLARSGEEIGVSAHKSYAGLTVLKGRIEWRPAAGKKQGVGRAIEINPGQTVFVPAAIGKFMLRAKKGPAQIIKSYVPV